MTLLVEKKAPNFVAPAVLADGSIAESFDLHKHIQNKYAILIFYPLDFTFVCPTELIALNNRIEAFKQRNTEIIAISIDSHFSHSKWRSTPTDQGGIGPVQYTMVADIQHNICQNYGVQSAGGVAYRASFLIDKEQTIHCQHINNLPIGRNIDELIRMVDALQFHEQHGEVCPAGWEKGKQGMVGSPEGTANYLKDNSSKL